MKESEKDGVRQKDKPLHAGHRQRMMQRFETGAEHFQDHEILEVLLYNAIPRTDTNPIAHALIKAFGSLAEVFRGSVKELMLVEGVGKKTAEYIRCIGLCFERCNDTTERAPLYFNPKLFSDYLEEEYRNQNREVLEVFCLNKLGKLFFRKEFSVGKIDEVKLDPTEISEILLVKKPFAVVVAHNHPHGTRNPSAQDDVFTKQLCLMCMLHNVRLGDHFIVGRDGIYSYHAVGKLDKIMNSCNEIRYGGGNA